MTFVSVTRLRIRSVRFLPAFAVHSWRSIAQVRRAQGFRGGSLLADRKWTFWTATAWEDGAAMRRYMAGGAHRRAMPRLIGWCDEASVVHWEQEGAELPDWRQADRRMRDEGRPSKVRHPGPDHAGQTYAPPRTAGAVALVPRG